MTTPVRTLRMPNPDRVFRVVQWATGRIGTSSLRELIDGPEFELVGVYVHSADKDGKDAGELAGRGPTGVKATRDIDALIALEPDCVVANMEGPNVDEVCRFLEAGINIATSRVDYLAPDEMDPEVRRKVEEACRKGGSSIHASGASPGFSSEALPLVAASMARRMDCLTIDEFGDIPASCPDVQVLGMGFGREESGEFNPHILAHSSYGFRQSVSVIARGLGLKLDDYRVFGETAKANARFVLPGGTPIEQGTVGAQRITIVGLIGGKEAIRYRINWYATTDIDRDWQLRENGWRLHLEGDTPIKVEITFPVSGEQLSPAMAGLTAYRVVNAVPFVVAADPGICTTVDLPNIAPRIAV